MVRASFAVTASLGLCLALGACDVIIGIPDRKLGVHLQCDEAKCICTDGYADCDGDPSDGCEVLLSASNEHCGACGNECRNGTCEGSVCECKKGFLDCDNSPKNGCEAELARDPDNCGTCGHGCLGGSCKEGRCQPFELQAFSYPQSITLVGQTLYVAACSAPNADPILQMPVTGGEPVPLATGMDCGIFQALSGSSLYWTNGDFIFLSSLDKVAPATQIATAEDKLKLLAAGGSYLYWGTLIPKPMGDTSPAEGAMYRAPLPLGVAEQLTSIPGVGLAADDKNAYWTDIEGLHALPHEAMAKATTLSTNTKLSALIVDNGTLYIMDSTDGASGIVSIPITGGTPKMVAPGAGAFGMGVDRGNIYWLDYFDGTVSELPLAGGDRRVLAEGLGYALNSDLAFDETAIYWLSDQSIYKMAK